MAEEHSASAESVGVGVGEILGEPPKDLRVDVRRGYDADVVAARELANHASGGAAKADNADTQNGPVPAAVAAHALTSLPMP